MAIPISQNIYSVETQYFSNSNSIVDPPYSGFTPYNFGVYVNFPTKNEKTGNDITYGVTKQEMLQNIISYFTGEPMTYGEMARTKIELPEKGNATTLSNALKDRNGNYIALGLDDGIDFTVVASTGGAKTDGNMYTLTGIATCKDLAPFLDSATQTSFLAVVS